MSQPHGVSFRGQLKGEVSDFIEKVGMGCAATATALMEVVVELSDYEEEGKALYPQLLICDSLAEMLPVLQGSAQLEIGFGEKTAATAKQALKKCAPLAQQGWSIYIERQSDEFRFGVFREPELPTALDLRSGLAALPAEPVKAIIVGQVAPRTVEIVGTGGRYLHVHLSAASTDGPAPSASINALVEAVVKDAKDSVREPLRSYLSSSLGRSLLHGHGALITVVPKGGSIPSQLVKDGTFFGAPIELAQHVENFIDSQEVSALLMLNSYSALLEGMLGSDGITLIRSDGALLGYNCFVEKDEQVGVLPSQLIGGARRRAFAALAKLVDSGAVSCAFIRSSNGSSEHKVKV
jgi:hypothetical protein